MAGKQNHQTLSRWYLASNRTLTRLYHHPTLANRKSKFGGFDDYDLPTKAATAVLTTALEAHQRQREAREAIAKDGMTVIARDGQLKAHPLLAVERDARQAWFAGIKALGLEL